MEKIINTQDIIIAVSQDMAKANAELHGDSPDKFNRAVLDLLQQEIAKAKPAAANWKYLCPGSREYTYTNQFPLAIFNELSEVFLVQLESAGIYLYRNPGANTAVIKIVFHF